MITMFSPPQSLQSVFRPRTREMSDAVDSDAFLLAPKKVSGRNRVTSRAVSARVDEAEIPGWVYRQFTSPDVESSAVAAPVRAAEGRRTATRVPQPHALEPTVNDLVHVALSRTGYPLHHICCRSNDETLILSGFVTRYFYAQIALETALRLANGRRIEAHIDVLPAPDRDQWDD